MATLCAVADIQDIEFCDSADSKTFSSAFEAFHHLLNPTFPSGLDDAPSQKRRKLNGTTAVNAGTKEYLTKGDSIVLAQASIDLQFPRDFSTIHRPDGIDNSVEVVLESFTQTSTNTFSVSLWRAGKQSTGINLYGNTSSLNTIAKHLDTAAGLSITENGKKRSRAPRAGFCQCVIYPPTDGTSVFRLETEIRWTLGMSVIEMTGPKKLPGRQDLGLLTTYLPHVSEEDTAPWSLQDFYENVHVPSTDSEVSPRIQAALNDTKLYPFQKRAVDWLLKREGVSFVDGEARVCEITSSTKEQLPASFKPARDATGRACYVSHTRGMVVTDLNNVFDPQRILRGGILAEEMGLGKTVELIALMDLNKRDMEDAQIFDAYTGYTVTPSGATLIITPPSILEQWMNEIQLHAPHLKVLHYEGIPSSSASKRKQDAATVESLLKYDVVLTTYHVLSREIHFAAPPPERSFRQKKQYEPRRSPLVQISWWRVCLDEAQMVESGVSNAATVARLIPRCNAWAVSGTPLRKDVQDLRGLLIFLRYEPFCGSITMWNRIDKLTFKQIFSQVAMRHTKDKIRKELRLPPQKRVVITVPFTAIEEQNYSELMKQMCEACGLSLEGAPTTDEWNPNDPTIVEKMREWLVRLRQTCLHANVGRKNRRALGRKNGPLRTVEEVLEVMIEQNDTTLKAEEREAVLARLGRGHIVANVKSDEHRSEMALEIYSAALAEASRFVQECRNELRAEQVSLGKTAALAMASLSDDGDDSDVEGKGGENLGRLPVLRKTLRSALELEHACRFFVGTSYFQIKSNENLTKAESEEFHRLEKLEVAFYDEAKAIRKELLRESQNRAQGQMQKITSRKPFTQIPKIQELEDRGGIENRKILESMDHISDILNEQAMQLDEWRKKVVEILLMPLVDEDEGKETTGDEYEDSTKVQDELYVYIAALRAIVADRNQAITGLQDVLVDHEMMAAKKAALEGEGHAPELFMKIFAVREKLKPTTKDGSLKGVISAVRSLVTTLQWQADGGHDRSMAELAIVEKQLAEIQRISAAQTKALAELEREQELFRTTMNQRLDFYRQLQHISDSVAPWREELDEELDMLALDLQATKEELSTRRLATLRTKQRFLLHLRDENKVDHKRICVICLCDFEVGVLTVCGHQYCKDCIRMWWHQHRNCPTCKRKLQSTDFHDITYKPQEMKAQEESHQQDSPDQPSSPSSQTSIYSDISSTVMDQIKAIDLEGSYGTKIDTIARHILWIRENDPGAKSIIFSQFNDFLEVLRGAFKHWKIGCSSISDKNGIHTFRTEPSAECFLLDAKSDSSGLNLVNATYVFLCEPLINPAIELQAIARVHRIGQQRPTTVYMYLISDTVEEAIYDISVSRRLEHMGRRQQDFTNESRSGSATPALQENAIDAANSMEMEQAPLAQLLRKKGDGEMVRQDDLWNCLFSKPRKRQQAVSQTLEMEVGRHLRAEAAEQRILEGTAVN